MARRNEPSAFVASAAAAIVKQHRDHLAEGFRLTGASRVWERRDGDCTGRFVYRNRESFETIAYTIRWADARPDFRS